jgi:predicted ABC-type ATPase
MFETTLASRTYARQVIEWRDLGYHVALIYLRLPSAEHSVERVRRRVATGGHGVPNEVIRRRFDKSVRYFDGLYKAIVNEWQVWDSLEGEFRFVQASGD